MDRDALFLLSLISLAIASVVVGVSGWVLWTRDHRAARVAGVTEPGDTDAPEHRTPTEDS